MAALLCFGPVSPDPLAEILQERERARAVGDPLTDVCILATAGRDGIPGLRPLILRDVGPQGVGLLVSASSLKWEPLRSGRYECLLLWTAIRRQYRLRGGLAPMPEERLEAYWREKIHESRLLELYYERVQPQSSRVSSREAFLAGIAALRRQYPTPEVVPRPEALRGVYLVPYRIEAWHGAPDRLHDRHLYTRTTRGWREEVLVP